VAGSVPFREVGGARRRMPVRVLRPGRELAVLEEACKQAQTTKTLSGSVRCG